MMYDLFLGIPYDLLPLLLIIILHRRNLYLESKLSKKNKSVRLYRTGSDHED